MANLGAEVSRIISAQEQHNADAASTALARAENILDEIGHLPDMKPRAQELESLAHALHSVAVNNTSDTGHHVSPTSLKSYFTPFAVRLMADK